MQITERQLRMIVREIMQEDAAMPAAGSGRTYSDSDGNQFKIVNGSISLVRRSPKSPKGQKGLPITIQKGKVAQVAKNLLTVPANSGDAALKALAGGQPPAAGGQGLTLGPNVGRLYPVTVDQIRRSSDFVHPTPAGTENCSEWAKRFVGFQGNAWFASKSGTLKYNAFANVSSYKSQAEALFKKMNATSGLSVDAASAFNAAAKAIASGVKPSPASLRGYMQIGDVVGMYFEKSKHHAEAFFEACSGWDLTHRTQVTSTNVKASDGAPWTSAVIGQNKSFVITSAFGPNTHLGFVGGMIDGDPIIFHNIGGKVHVNRLSTISSTGAWPVWVKAGSGGGGGGAPPADASSMWQRVKSQFQSFL